MDFRFLKELRGTSVPSRDFIQFQPALPHNILVVLDLEFVVYLGQESPTADENATWRGGAARDAVFRRLGRPVVWPHLGRRGRHVPVAWRRRHGGRLRQKRQADWQGQDSLRRLQLVHPPANAPKLHSSAHASR